jgi:hypothetical protein
LPPTDEEALARFRGFVRSDDTLRAAVDAIVEFGQYVVLIEGKAARKSTRRGVPTISLIRLSMSMMRPSNSDLQSAHG